MDRFFRSDDLSMLSDNELISIIHADETNSKAAATQLISRYLGLVRKKALFFSKNSLCHPDTEDYSQEGLMALLKAFGTFSESNGSKFSSYASVCIENRLKSASAKQHGLTVPVGDAEITEVVTPESIFVEKEHTEDLYRKVSSLLTEKEWGVFKLYLDNLSYGEIARRLNISEKSVDNAVFRVRRKLRNLLKD